MGTSAYSLSVRSPVNNLDLQLMFETQGGVCGNL